MRTFYARFRNAEGLRLTIQFAAASTFRFVEAAQAAFDAQADQHAPFGPWTLLGVENCGV